MKFKFLIIFTIFFSYQYASAESKYTAQSCVSSKNNEKIVFTSKEVADIVNKTGLEQRSICSFIKLGSSVYPVKVLKTELLNNKGIMKTFLNKHVLFPKNEKFFQEISEFLFSSKYTDSEQVLNTLVLSDFLYGYKVGETIPAYMQIFLFYSSDNKSKEEQDSIKKIMPYILYVESQLLSKTDFTDTNTGEFITKVKNDTLEKVQDHQIKKEREKAISESELQDSPY